MLISYFICLANHTKLSGVLTFIWGGGNHKTIFRFVDINVHTVNFLTCNLR